MQSKQEPAGASLPANQVSPHDFIRSSVGKRISVHVISGYVYKGILISMDGAMNIAMEQTEEFINDTRVSQLNDCFIRGNVVRFVAKC